MKRQKLTAGRVRDFECPAETKQAFLWDNVVPGLGVRSTKGAKVFIFQGRLDGKTIRLKIGDTRTWVIDSTDNDTPGARQEARRLQRLIDKGIDPRLEKKDRIAETRKRQAEAVQQEETVSDAWKAYLKARKEKWSKRHYQDHVDLSSAGGEKRKKGKGNKKAGPLAQLMEKRLIDLTPSVIEAWVKSEAPNRGARIRLAFSLLRAFLNWCDAQKEYKNLVSKNPCTNLVRREFVPRMKPKADCLQKEQLAEWFKAIRALDNPVISAFLQSLLLTGARRNELSSLKWKDLDLKWNGMTIRDKVEGQRVIPLTPYVKKLLTPLPRRNLYVFSSLTSKSGRISEPRHAHDRALAVAGINGLTIHGLRRSFGTLSEWAEVPAGVVEQIQGHKPLTTPEKYYRKRPLDLLRMWHVKIEKLILDEAEIQQPKNE